MKKTMNIMAMAAVALFCSCSKSFDDGSLRERIDGYQDRLEAIAEKVEALNSEIADLSYLTNGNVITSVSQDGDGKYVLTYINDNDEARTVVIATMDDIIDVPIVGVAIHDDGAYYWTTTVDGATEWLTSDGSDEKLPVAGYTPTISVDEGGYWTVDGVRLTDTNGDPIEANSDATSVFSSAALDAEGNFSLTLGDGSVVTLPVFNSLNLKLNTVPVTTIADLGSNVVVNYELSGSAKDNAIVALAKVEGVEAALDRDAKTITVSFDASFTGGKVIVMAHDPEGNTIIKPLFFKLAGAAVTTISTADELMAYAAAVNAGGDESVGKAILTQDIDMGGIAEWVPIGNASYAGSSSFTLSNITGTAFKGEFDGQGHSLKNLKMAYSGGVTGTAYGLFGIIDGGTVRNLTIGAPSSDDSSLTVTATAGIASTGVLAGAVRNGVISGCTSYADIIYNSASTSRIEIALVGFMYSNGGVAKLEELNNYGPLNIQTNGNATAGAGTAIHAAGICGFANGVSGSVNEISYCNNYGDITSDAGRSAGIVAAANSYTALNSCVNNGDHVSSVGGTGRLGNITCLLGNGGSMTDCVNNGDLISTSVDGARIGGLLSLVGHAATSYSGCANYGEIISNSNYRGAFFGYTTQAGSGGVVPTWVNCVVSGKVGVYNNGTYIYDQHDEANKSRYMGARSGTDNSLFDNIVYMIGEEGGGGPVIEPTLRILFIGNSFTKDAVEHLPGMVSAAGIGTLKMTHLYYGGRTIPEYSSGYATTRDYTCYKYEPGTSVWLQYSGYNIEETVLSDKWDIVCIQEHTGNKAAWTWNAAEKQAIDDLIANIEADQPDNTPRFVYIMSQAYFDMNRIGTGSRPTPFTTQDEMFDVIVAQAKKVLDETEVDQIIPTGTALQNLRTSALNNMMDLTRDGYHMDYGVARYAASCVVFESLISPGFDGILLDDNTFRYTTSSTVSGSYSTPVTDTNQPVALQAARYALADPFTVTDMAEETQTPDNGTEDIEYEEDPIKE